MLEQAVLAALLYLMRLTNCLRVQLCMFLACGFSRKLTNSERKIDFIDYYFDFQSYKLGVYHYFSF